MSAAPPYNNRQTRNHARRRAQTLLKTLIERYIAEGQPVGSRTLSRIPGLELSPATIRNVMSDLEDMGFIASPHTSAGRIPTPRGYRLFVDTLLTVRPLAQAKLARSRAHPARPTARLIRSCLAAAVGPDALRRRGGRAAPPAPPSARSSSCACRKSASC